MEPNQKLLAADIIIYIPPTVDVAITDPVSKYNQNTMANHTKLFVAATKSVIPRSFKKDPIA
jgi:hypothetical protein